MAALDKLINLLEQVKETNPDFTAKAEKALDVLVGEDIEEEQEIVEEEIEEEPFDDSYIEIDSGDLQKVVELQKATTALVTSLGTTLKFKAEDVLSRGGLLAMEDCNPY